MTFNRSFTWSVRWFAGLLLLCSVLLTGCSESELKFNGSDIAGAGIGEQWELIDFDGQTVSPATLKGKVSLVFFGFTQCPDICPTALAEVAHAVSLLGHDAQDVEVLMISVDPERDTPEILKAYLGAFDKELPTRFTGLRGDPEQIRRAAGSFRAFYAKVPTPGGGYTMDHSTSFYLMDKSGKARVLLGNQAGAQAIAQDMMTLLKS